MLFRSLVAGYHHVARVDRHFGDFGIAGLRDAGETRLGSSQDERGRGGRIGQVGAFQLEGVDLPDPPPSAALILAGSQASFAGISQTRNSKIAEMAIDAGDAMISGSKTIQVEIKE